jgi:hypothetical protein
MQNRRISLIESLTNTFTGMGISFLIQLFLFPLMGIPVTIHQNIIITGVFTIASIGRGYIVRRVFNTLMKRLLLIFFVSMFFVSATAPAGRVSVSILAGDPITDRSLLTLCNVRYEIERLGIKEPDKVLQQVRLETGDLTSNICLQYNNLVGMKYPHRRQTRAIGRHKSIAVYRTWKESIEDYKIWQDAFYRGGDYYDFLRGRYATDKKYIDKLKAL